MIHTLKFLATMVAGVNDKRRSEEGATAVEYGLMVALIAIGIITAVVFLQGQLSGLFNDVGNELSA